MHLKKYILITDKQNMLPLIEKIIGGDRSGDHFIRICVKEIINLQKPFCSMWK